MAEEPDIRPGQIWADNSTHGYGRLIRVVEIVYRHVSCNGADPLQGVPHAIVEQVSGRQVDEGKPGRRTAIRLNRFRPTSTGYRLATDVPDESDHDG